MRGYIHKQYGVEVGVQFIHIRIYFERSVSGEIIKCASIDHPPILYVIFEHYFYGTEHKNSNN